ncbi:hypothetical protein [Antiquaquibacter soli]|uniref:Uncharacterized protein n=1 Tax=Antiquaquibacter soli TaxID=3064523 RepID=A0ABT9BMZ7_9MICO|nr:hypothetical protein [Protaetiibacter sp. WY-16]MDO7880795.1 hypothetical protein [Protaetiibacter sp. WY-16]
MIAVVLLVIALIATGVFLYLALQRLEEARQEIEEQQELIDKKETFASAAEDLQATAAKFDGLPYATLVTPDYYASLIGRGWSHRWNGPALDKDTEDVKAATAELEDTLAAAEAQASSNATGTIFESLTDSLGSGFVATSLDTADAACEQDVWGCVSGEDPFTIHYDNAETAGQPYMNDFLRTGLAYHEYAHVLQMTNPEPTETAAEAFGGDWETMADCYALTYLPGWTLDHTIWVSDYEYWEVSVGYGYTCNADQAQVVRDWVSQLGYHHEPISQ